MVAREFILNYYQFRVYIDINWYNWTWIPSKTRIPPGAGSPPPELVGRDPILEQARILLGRVKQKKPEKSMLLTGLRGVGKTVLLNEIKRMADSAGYRTITIEAHEGKALGPLSRRICAAFSMTWIGLPEPGTR